MAPNLSPQTQPIDEELVAVLRQVPLFSELPRGELKYLSYTLHTIEVEPNTLVFEEGETGETFAIVIQGHVDVVMSAGTTDEKLLTTLGPGEYVGEMSLLIPGGKRSASVRSQSHARMWIITREDFDELLHRQPHVAYAMIKVMSERLRRSDNAAFRDLVEKNRELQTAYDDLKAAQAQIIEKERLEKELQLAAQIQVSILPRTFPHALGFDFGGHMDPARAVGGDFYDIFQIDAHRVGVLIGDVADKGVPSAIFMARAHALLTAQGLEGKPPAAVLRSVNDYLTRLDPTNLFVTVIYGIVDIRSGEFTYARAGHELPMLVHANGEVFIPLMESSLPIGLFEQISYREQSILFAPGDSLLLFTDGMCDCRNPQGEEFGHQRLQDTFRALACRPAQAACDGLVQNLLDFRQEAFQDDDVTLVTVHRA
jgi:phosphoserine phosphatase RsbU/P